MIASKSPELDMPDDGLKKFGAEVEKGTLGNDFWLRSTNSYRGGCYGCKKYYSGI